MRSLRLALVLVVLGLGRAVAANAPAPEVIAGRAALERALSQAAQQIAKLSQDGVVAMANLRPTTDAPESTAHATALQDALVPVLLREGILLLPFEGEHPVTVAYKNGKLPSGILLGPDDGRYLIDRGAKFLLVPELVEKESSDAITLDVYDLAKGQKALGTGAAVSTKKAGIADLAGLEVLPARNVKVLLFAIAHLGQQVDRGECWDLAAHAVRDDGGKVDGYVFGKEVPWEQALPGDVVTFGTGGDTGGHVTVLFRYAKTRATATILHQNYNNIRKVGLGPLGPIEAVKAGQRLAIWRP